MTKKLGIWEISDDFKYQWEEKQPKYPSTDECIKTGVYIMEYYLAPKKNKIIPLAATWMELEIIILREISRKKTNAIWYHLHVESKMWNKWTYIWNRIGDRENRLVVARVQGMRGRDGVKFGISRRKLLYRGWLSNKVLLCSTGKHIQYPVTNHNGKEWKIHIGKSESLCCTAEINTTCKSTIFQ